MKRLRTNLANMSKPALILATFLVMTAFASNSILCRYALVDQKIDAASFTGLRLVSGSIILILMVRLSGKAATAGRRKNPGAILALFLYAAAFSFAYRSLGAATGALILFAAVQATMIAAGICSGHRLHTSEWLGSLVAFSGLTWLVLPGVSAPSTVGFLLMFLAGTAWGIYSLFGRHSDTPLVNTANNFHWASLLAVILALAAMQRGHYTVEGVSLALVSGGVASAPVYVAWYAVLRHLSAVQAAVVQLSAPLIAAIGGVLFLSEHVTLRLAVSSLLILGGILLTIAGRYYFAQPLRTYPDDG